MQKIMEPARKLAEKYIGVRCLDPREITIRSQMRGEVRDENYIRELAQSMISPGQLNEVLVNEVIEDGKVLLVLIAGEHRVLAVLYVMEHPELWGADGICPAKGVFAKVYRGLNEFERWVLMGAENLYKPPTTMEYLKQVESAWNEAKRLEVNKLDSEGPAKLNATYVARQLGQSPEKFRRAIRVLECLDNRLQEMLHDGKLPYNQAAEIAMIPERLEQLRVTKDVKANKLRSQKAIDYIRKRRSELSNERKAKEEALFALTIEEASQNLGLSLGKHLNLAVNDGIAYMQTIVDMVESGVLEPGKQFSKVDRGRAAILEGLASDILTNVGSDELVGLNRRLISRNQLDPVLRTFALRVVQSCPGCVLYKKCSSQGVMSENRTQGKCLELVMNWFYQEVAKTKEVTDDSPERKAM